jgi:hypothetical protein
MTVIVPTDTMTLVPCSAGTSLQRVDPRVHCLLQQNVSVETPAADRRISRFNIFGTKATFSHCHSSHTYETYLIIIINFTAGVEQDPG